MEISEKKEPENNNNISQTATLDSSSTTDIIDKESEERQARELKAGLHPLKVPNPSLSLSHTHPLLCVFAIFLRLLRFGSFSAMGFM
jgi:hypothetical protein